MSWIDDIQGLTTVLDPAGAPVQRRSVIQFAGAAVVDDGTKTVVTIDGGTGGAISGRLLRFTEYLSGSGTHVWLSTSRTRIAHLQGGGGGAGGVTGTGGTLRAAAGAQAGGFREVAETGAPTGTGVYAVGAAGAAGNGGTPTNGGDGSNTTLGMNAGTQTATGGVGSDTVAGTGGIVQLNLPRLQSTTAGEPGANALVLSASVAMAGQGGSTRYGSGGQAKSGAGSSANAICFGAGGSGANNTAASNGGAGASGLIRIWEFS